MDENNKFENPSLDSVENDSIVESVEGRKEEEKDKEDVVSQENTNIQDNNNNKGENVEKIDGNAEEEVNIWNPTSSSDITKNNVPIPQEHSAEEEHTVNFTMHDIGETQNKDYTNANINKETKEEYIGNSPINRTRDYDAFEDEPQSYEDSYGDYYDACRVKEENGEEKKQLFSISNIIVASLTLILSVVVGFIIGGVTINHMLNQKSILISTTHDKIVEEYVFPIDELGVSTIARNCKTSVVAITTQSTVNMQTLFGIYQQQSQGSGSGVIIGKTNDELLIVTNYHVIEDATSVSVCFNDNHNQVYSGAIKSVDEDNDLAIVVVNFANIDDVVLKTLSIATIGNSNELEIGDGVVAIGNALGLGQTVTTGIISAKEREVKLQSGVRIRLLQTDAAINPGNSGGALFNMQGELIGINCAKYSSEDVEGMGFAIPISQVRNNLETMISKKTRTSMDSGYGVLSIVGQTITSNYTTMFGMPEGVYLVEVGEGGSAYNGGLMKGDIITRFDDVKVTTIDKLVDKLHYYLPEEQVAITYYRFINGEYIEQTTIVILDKEMIGIDSTTTTQKDESVQNYYDSYYDNYYNDYYNNEYNNSLPNIIW